MPITAIDYNQYLKINLETQDIYVVSYHVGKLPSVGAEGWERYLLLPKAFPKPRLEMIRGTVSEYFLDLPDGKNGWPFNEWDHDFFKALVTKVEHLIDGGK